MTMTNALKILGLILAIVAPTALATKYVCDKTHEIEIRSLNNDFAEYKKFEELNIPKTLNTLNTTLGELEKHAKTINERSELIQKNKDLDTKNKNLTSELEEKKDEIKHLSDKLELANDELARLTSDSVAFSLKVNQSEKLLGGDVIIGLSYVSEINGYAEVSKEDSQHRMYVGQYFLTKLPGKRCKTVLRQTTSDRADFEFICKPATP